MLFEFGGRGEVGIEDYIEIELDGLQRVVRQLEVFVHSLAEKARDPDFQRLFRHGDHAAASIVGRAGIDARRGHDVVAHPAMLLHVG